VPRVISLKKKNKQYEVNFGLENNNEDSFICSEDLVVSYRLVRGKELNAVEYQIFIKDQAIDYLLQRSLRYSMIAYRSTEEINKYLKKLGADLKTVDLITSKLKIRGLIDDEAFARKLVEVHFYEKRDGKEKILFTLEKRGFPVNLVKAIIAEISPRDVERNLERLFAKKITSLNTGSLKAVSDKMKRFLLGKGYGIYDVMTFVNQRQSDFSEYIDEEKEIIKDMERLRKRLERTEKSKEALKQKLIKSLIARGYKYALINQILERRS